MEKEFVPYELALRLKELGFDEPCFGYYYTLNGKDWKFAEKSEYNRLDDEINIGGKFSLLVPTFSQAFEWFREKHNQHCFIHYHSKPEYTFAVYNDIKMYWTLHEKISFNTYEEAELACLKKLIEIVKKK
jgi:hypothetical protein